MKTFINLMAVAEARMGRNITAQVGVASGCETRRPGTVKMPRESCKDGSALVSVHI